MSQTGQPHKGVTTGYTHQEPNQVCITVSKAMQYLHCKQCSCGRICFAKPLWAPFSIVWANHMSLGAPRRISALHARLIKTAEWGSPDPQSHTGMQAAEQSLPSSKASKYEACTAKGMLKRPAGDTDSSHARMQPWLSPPRGPHKRRRIQDPKNMALRRRLLLVSRYGVGCGPETTISVDTAYELMCAYSDISKLRLEKPEAYNRLWSIIQEDDKEWIIISKQCSDGGLFSYQVSPDFDRGKNISRETDVQCNHAAKNVIRIMLQSGTTRLMLNYIREQLDPKRLMLCTIGPGDDWIRNLKLFPTVFWIGTEVPTDQFDYCIDFPIELLCEHQLREAGVHENFRLLSNKVLGLPEKPARHLEVPSWNVTCSTGPSLPPRPPPPAPPAPPPAPPWRNDSSWSEHAGSGSRDGAQSVYHGKSQSSSGQYTGPWYMQG